MYTTASVFFKTLADAGITHAFVNWGSDHSAFLEELQRQRDADGKTSVEIVTCPSEYVALSAAIGYAQATCKPAAVIVHVDVGTQALAGAIHNADRGQVPVLIFAGAAPFTANGELHGTKNEFIMWLQDVPDQASIVRQYMRYTAQIHSGKNAAKTIMRALQIATSQPKGPVYLWARREVTDEEVDEAVMNAPLPVAKWPPVSAGALSPEAADTIASALLAAKFPLMITANVGRNPAAFAALSTLSRELAAGVFSCASSALAVPASHPHFLGHSFFGKLPYLADADVVLVLDVDIPWVDVQDNRPRAGARVFVVDSDPLKRTLGWSHVDAEMLCRADAATALHQLLDAACTKLVADASASALEIRAKHDAWLQALAEAEAVPSAVPDATTPTVPYILATLREAARAATDRVLWLNEAASMSGLIWNHIRAERAGSVFMSGGTSLGYILGASVGAHLGNAGHELIVAITGDGNFLFGVPTSAYWMARRYNTASSFGSGPFLTLVLNNGGWFSPKFSMLAVHPQGVGSSVSGEQLTVGFGEEGPDYGGIAAAAGGAWARRVTRADELWGVFEEAIRVVREEKRCAVVECVIESI